jgi:hypothetical protein
MCQNFCPADRSILVLTGDGQIGNSGGGESGAGWVAVMEADLVVGVELNTLNKIQVPPPTQAETLDIGVAVVFFRFVEYLEGGGLNSNQPIYWMCPAHAKVAQSLGGQYSGRFIVENMDTGGAGASGGGW